MTKSVTQETKSTQEKREKKTYDGTPIPEGYVLAPVWLKRDFVNEASYIKSENLTIRKYAGITFLIGYVAIPSEKYEGLKQDCDEQINVYLKKRYCDIVTMKLAGVEMDVIFEKLQLKSSRGYQVVDECGQACRKFFGLYRGKKKKKK